MMASTDSCVCVEGSRAHAPHVRTKESALVKDGGTNFYKTGMREAEDWEMRIWIVKQWDNYIHWVAES